MTQERWERLKRGRFDVGASQPGVDPMWVWADATDYRDHMPKGLDPTKGAWFVVENAGAADPASGRFMGERLTPAQWPSRKSQIARIELAMPVVPERPTARRLVEQPSQSGEAVPGKAAVLVGIIDSGCPFAARMIRDASGLGTRVLGLWDQDDQPAFTECGGYLPQGPAYGCAIDREGLNKLMAQALRPDDFIDEDLCYRLAEYDVVRGRLSHGAAVMSQLFAQPVYGGALQPSPGKPPRWDASTRAVDEADLVFVQIPRAGVQDSTSAALARYVIDGLRYIVGHARKGVTKRIVVNISSGTSRTLHDGTSILETALSAFIDEMKQRSDIDLWIVVPVGNTNEEQRHAVLSDAREHLEFFLPPGCEMPQYVTVRWPKGASGVHLRITPPGGLAGTIRQGEGMAWPNAHGPECGVVSPAPAEREAARTLIAFAPTASHDPTRVVARSGGWRVELVFEGPQAPMTEPIKFWISRNQRNPGALPRGRQADFVDWDESHNPQRYLRRTLDDPNEPVRNGIRRNGALSGLAAVKRSDGHMVVVGGYVVSDPTLGPSRYSAAGPAAGNSTKRRIGPDVSAPSDTSWALPGLSVHGNRSGEVVRVVGTSFAAPLVARAIVNAGGRHPRDKPTEQRPRDGRPLRR